MKKEQQPQQAKYSFEIPPDPIPESKIAKTIKTGVVVIGAGTAGLVCANSAAESGADVILISASSKPISRGGSNHAINSKLTRHLGIKYDIGRNFKQEIDRAGGRIDQAKWSLFANRSGEAMDWLIDKMVAAGYTPVLEKTETDPEGLISAYPGSHSFLGGNIKSAGIGQPLVVKTLAKTAREAGVQIHYNIIAKQLVRQKNNTGRVTAVIARDTEGKYIKYAASKAVVLATGDFTKDREMVSKYCPEALPLVAEGPARYNTQFALGGVYAGDGHKMGLWAGAAWQKTIPNAPMINGAIHGGPPNSQPYAAFKGLMVNKCAVRYCNEDATLPQASIMQLHQPDRKICAVWDSDYAKKAAPWYPFGSYYGCPEKSIDDVVAEWEADVKSGATVKANSIKELAEKLDLDPDAFQQTVDRYNGFCKTGVDEDFFKRAGLLFPIKKAPFYGNSGSVPILLIITGGLRTNAKMQVLDKDDVVIPGLYAVGTVVGDMFANYYSFMPSGIHYGATCVTFGYVAGKEIAGA
jgi:fumarate reductase flavoprotein subunit